MSRKSESEKAARVLRRILAENAPAPGVSPKDRREALELAISLLDARAFDADAMED